ncbi:helix-turn-helix domain-containing protein [Flavobacterium luteolum]|uniref:helix-turn-helix domain-containing protein n=1 Tax=Flavobacterium luteolum TaxID=3003259 RepID=UPI00248F03FE|nr:helix-turn-helix domain-containing protein [Flavobacterium luteolum]
MLAYSIYQKEDLINRIASLKLFRPQFPSLLFIKAGTITFKVNKQLNTYSKNDVAFIMPRNVYEFIEISSDSYLYLIDINVKTYKKLRFKFNRFEMYRAVNFQQRNSISVHSEDFTSSMLPLLDILYYYKQEKEHAVYNNEIVTQLFTSLIYMVVSHVDKALNSSATELSVRKKQLVFDFLELATKNFNEHRELKYYSDLLNVSIKYLSICNKEVTGFPPTYILKQLILREAYNRLADENEKIANISDDLKFSDLASFSKFFKKNSGVSPYQFRKEIKSAEII